MVSASVHLRYFNLFGILGWFVNGTLLRRRLLPARQIGIFNRMVPLFIRMEKIIPTLGGSIPDRCGREGLERRLNLKLSVIIPVYNEVGNHPRGGQKGEGSSF